MAGKMLIVGGNAHGFAAPAEAYGESLKAGIGVARVVLPDSLRKTVGKTFEAGEYAASTPSGSFARETLGELLAMANWADGVLIAGDLGRNSETAILLETFAQKYSGQLTITQDALDYFTKSPTALLKRENTAIVASFAQLQKIAGAVKSPSAFTFDMDLIRLVESLHGFTEQYAASIIVKHLESILAATGGQVSSTRLQKDLEIWRAQTAARAAVWWLQNPAKTFEALTTSISGI